MKTADFRMRNGSVSTRRRRGAISAVIEEAQRTDLRTASPGGTARSMPIPTQAAALPGASMARPAISTGVSRRSAANGLDHGDYLESLQRAGGDEAAFHKVFTKLSADPKLDDKTLAALAGAYCGKAEAWPERSAALGAIETSLLPAAERFARPRQTPLNAAE